MFPQVLATVGGSGTRLYPLTLDLPKPLVELCDTAIIANLFRVLASQGCRRFILGSKGANNTLNLSNYFKAGDGFFKRLGITDYEGFYGDLIPYLTENDYPVYGYPITGYWIDIGTPERLHQAAMDLMAGKLKHFTFRHEYWPAQWIHPSTWPRSRKTWTREISS